LNEAPVHEARYNQTSSGIEHRAGETADAFDINEYAFCRTAPICSTIDIKGY
jgi:hypothetical protein